VNKQLADIIDKSKKDLWGGESKVH
jgi:hypothetical protein